MKFLVDEQQQMIESSALDWLRNEYPFEQRARSMKEQGSCSPRIWNQFAEMGWLGLPLSERVGGFGAGAFETGLLMRAFGRHLVVEPFHACILVAARLIAEAGSPKQREAWLPSIVAGQLRAALAHDEPSNREPWTVRHTRARRVADGWLLDGRKLLVLGASGAELLIVSASTDDEGSSQAVSQHRLFVLRPDVPGLGLRVSRTADGGQASDLELQQVRVGDDALLGENGDATSVLVRVRSEAMVASCWEAVGAMSAAFEQTVAYTQQRRQFGQSLSQFQVVAHRLAEMAVQCEEALAACELAALRIDRGESDLLALGSMAKSKVGRAANFVAKEVVQLHGAMGVSEELPIAATFRKLNAFAQQGGSTAWHSRHFGRAMLASGAWRESRTLPPWAASVQQAPVSQELVS